MTKKLAKKMFDAYNPADKVILCPYERAGVQELLDIYAKVTVTCTELYLKTRDELSHL